MEALSLFSFDMSFQKNLTALFTSRMACVFYKQCKHLNCILPQNKHHLRFQKPSVFCFKFGKSTTYVYTISEGRSFMLFNSFCLVAQSIWLDHNSQFMQNKTQITFIIRKLPDKSYYPASRSAPSPLQTTHYQPNST